MNLEPCRSRIDVGGRPLPMNQRWLSASSPDPSENHFLAALPVDQRARIFPNLELVDTPLDYALYEPGIQMRYAYFPLDAIVSLLCVMADGASGATAVVGNEGIVGISALMGGDTMSSWAVVQSPGHAYRLKWQLLKDEFNRGGAIQRQLLRYTQSLLTQMAQTAVCNRHHSLDQQFCRWLLLSHDRLPSNEVITTHERIANILGVRRESITDIAGSVQRAGLIECKRGRIIIIDRAGLEGRACECYAVVKRESDRLVQ